jgi:uncharacterized protein (DUF488 family)
VPLLTVGHGPPDRAAFGARLTTAGVEAIEDGWRTVRQVAAYAAHTRTAEFGAALDDVLAGTCTVAVMCSESVWWRYHRRLIADVAVLGRGVPVRADVDQLT